MPFRPALAANVRPGTRGAQERWRAHPGRSAEGRRIDSGSSRDRRAVVAALRREPHLCPMHTRWLPATLALALFTAIPLPPRRLPPPPPAASPAFAAFVDGYLHDFARR